MASAYDKHQVVYLKDDVHLSWNDIAKEIGYSKRTCQRWYNDIKEATDTATEYKHFDLKPDVDRERFQPMVASGDMMVTCDWHVPLYDPDMINSLLKKTAEHKIKKLIIGGDFFNGDSASRYDDKQLRKEAGYKPERTHSLEIFDVLLDVYDEIYLFEGNHDFRFVRLFNRELDLTEVVKDVLLAGLDKKKLEKLRISILDYMLLGQHKPYRFSHQKNFSTVPLSVGRKFAAKYRMSIITAHSHQFGIGLAQDGNDVIIEGGGLYDKNITEYIQKSSEHHEWVQGFTMFKDGVPTLFSPAFGNL